MNKQAFIKKCYISYSHIFVILLVFCFLTTGKICFDKKAITKTDVVYLDPVDTAFTAQEISKFTININENLPALEENLFFAQDKNEEYLDKKLAKNNFNTQKTKLEHKYVVEGGDTITGIAEKFNMHVATIYERNSLSAENIENIKPGDTLIIPAYDNSNSDKWLADLNQKKEEERQRLLALEQERLEAERQATLVYSYRNTYTRDDADYDGYNTTSENTSGYNGYPWGWCTYYAASRRNVPSNWGNAGEWLGSAQASGYSTGSEPIPGAIMVTGESWWGHVAIVESVSGDSITVSEMNYDGWGVTSSRTLSKYNMVIKGFIY